MEGGQVRCQLLQRSSPSCDYNGAMATIGVRELKARASDILDRTEAGEPFLITRRGRPVAVVLPFNIETEDLILAQAPSFIKLREAARSEHRKGQTLAWEDVRATSSEGDDSD